MTSLPSTKTALRRGPSAPASDGTAVVTDFNPTRRRRNTPTVRPGAARPGQAHRGTSLAPSTLYRLLSASPKRLINTASLRLHMLRRERVIPARSLNLVRVWVRVDRCLLSIYCAAFCFGMPIPLSQLATARWGGCRPQTPRRSDRALSGEVKK